MAIGDSTSLLFRIKGDSSDAVRAIRETEGAAGGLTGSLAGLANPAALAATAVAAIGTAAVGAGVALFNVAKAASDYGSKIFDASEKTGLAAETLSALNFAAEQSGSSLEAVTGGLGRFAKTIGDAANGSDQAQAKLKLLGVTSTDLDTALGQALTTIAKYPPGVQQMTAAQAAFGKSGADLLPFIKSFDGDLPGLIAKCKELGLTIDGKTAKAADDFGDSLDTLTKQLGLVGRTIGVAVIPAFTKLFTDLSGWLSKNKEEITIWADVIARVFKATLTLGQNLVRGLLDAKDFFATGISGGSYEDFLKKVEERNRLVLSPDTGPAYLPGGRKSPDPGTFAGGGTATRPKVNVIEVGRADSQEEADKTAGRDRRANLQIEVNNLQEQSEALATAMETLREQFEKNGDFEKFKTGVVDAFGTARTSIQDTLKYVEELERKQLGNATEGEKALLQQQQQERRNDLTKQGIELQKENVKVVEEVNKKTADQIEKEQDRLEKMREQGELLDEFNQKLERQAEIQERIDAAAERAIFRDDTESDPLNAGLSGAEGALGLSLPSIFGPQDEIKSQAEFMKDIYRDVADTAGQAIGSMVDGLAQLAANWLITGKFSAKAALSMLASIALSFAAQAGFAALMEVAHGVAESAKAAASLAVGDVAGAALHTTAAGLHYAAASAYGVVAAVAGGVGVGLGLAARAAGGGSSGNSQSAKGAFAGATGPQRLERNVDGQGKAYSGQEELTLGGSTNARNPREHVVRLVLRTAGVVDAIVEDVSNNGRTRGLIIETAT